MKAIIFDFDGIICESNKVKAEAYFDMYIKYGTDIADQVLKHHMANGGMSRFEKFKLYHARFLGDNINEHKLLKLCDQYSNLVLQKVIKAPLVAGVLDFIKDEFNNFDFYICTGTPYHEIVKILEAKKIQVYFKEVYGSPIKKDIHVKNILEKHNYNLSDVIFIGDAISDRDAANLNGIKFIARFTEEIELKKEKYLIDDFNGFNDFLKKINFFI